MNFGTIKSTAMLTLVMGGLLVTGCTNNSGGSSAAPPATSAQTPANGSGLDVIEDSGSTYKDEATLKRIGCSSSGELGAACIAKLAKGQFPKIPMYTKQGSYNVSLKGNWVLTQMYQAREDRSFRKMRGINHDYSKAGPMMVWNNSAQFSSWAYEDYNYISHRIGKTRDGAVRFEFERDSRWVNDTFVLECFVPAMMEAKKLLCTWYHLNPRTDRDEFRGYIEFDRAKRKLRTAGK